MKLGNQIWGKRKRETYSYTFKDIVCACETGRKYEDKLTGFVQGGWERGEGGRETVIFVHISQKS
jgi:hypothetical protein